MPNLFKFGKKKKERIQGNLIIDNPDIKIATATYNGTPFVISIGTTEERTVGGEGFIDATGGKGKYQSQKALNWKTLYDPEVFPKMVPLDNLKAVAASTIAVASGSADVFKGEFTERSLKGVEEGNIEKKLSRSVSLSSSVTVKGDARIVKKEEINNVTKAIEALIEQGLLDKPAKKKNDA